MKKKRKVKILVRLYMPRYLPTFTERSQKYLIESK